MKSILVASAMLALSLSGCASSLDRGVTAYNAGEYDKAAASWNADAIRGEPNAQYNVGLLWRGGLGSTPQDRDEAAAWFLKAARQGQTLAMVELAKIQLETDQPDHALSWLNLAARWNEPSAISLLQSMQAPVPAPDLYQSNIQLALVRQQQQAEAQAQAGHALGCLLAGGCPQQNSIPSYSPQPGSRTYRLQQSWWEAGKRLCRYADGSVVNAGTNTCRREVTSAH